MPLSEHNTWFPLPADVNVKSIGGGKDKPIPSTMSAPKDPGPASPGIDIEQDGRTVDLGKLKEAK